MRLKSITRIARRELRIISGREQRTRIDCRIEKERFGNEYGGFDVATRYLKPDSVVYSFGVGEDVSFDLALIERFGLTIHAFDPTPRSIEWVRRQSFPQEFVMHEFGIADVDGRVAFHLPLNPAHVSHTILDTTAASDRTVMAPVRRLSTIMKELGHDRIDVLKMDVEGAEYAVIVDISRSPIRPGQILIEFHHRFPGVGFEQTRKALDTLKSMGYCLFSVSESGEEYGFLHRKRAGHARQPDPGT